MSNDANANALRSLRILCMTWNTQSVRLAETCGGASAPLAGSWFDMSYKRYDPDFLPVLLQKIQSSECDWFVCALQESAKPGSHFLSDALPQALAALDFEPLHRNRMMGIGATTVQALVRDGTMLTRGLRLAVFVKRSWLSAHRCSLDENWWHATPRDLLTRGKGALAICVHVAGLGRVCLMNCHLPFDAPSVAHDNAARVTTGMSEQVCALRSLIERCCVAHVPHYLIVMGDLNFRVLNLSDGSVQPNTIFDALVRSPESRQNVFERRDELRIALEYGALPKLNEGCDNSGAWHFMPTGKMRHGRESGTTDRRAYFFGKRCEQNPSWCDRILYVRTEDWSGDEQSFAADRERCEAREGGGCLQCLEYDRFEAGQTMTRSDHSAVIATFDLHYLESERQRTHAHFAPSGGLDDEPMLMGDVHLCQTESMSKTETNVAVNPSTLISDEPKLEPVVCAMPARDEKTDSSVKNNDTGESIASDKTYLLQTASKFEREKNAIGNKSDIVSDTDTAGEEEHTESDTFSE